MSTTHVALADPDEYGYFIDEPNDNGETRIERHPLIGYTVKVSEKSPGGAILGNKPVCRAGERIAPSFISRYDGTFSDSNGDLICHSLTEMMKCLGFEPDDSGTLPPTDAKELSEYVWRPLRNPQD